MKGNKKKITIPADSDTKESTVEEGDFKQSLVDTLQESNTARNEMKTVLHEILKQPDTINEIKEIIDKADRDTVKAFWKKFGFAVWSALIFAAGVVTTILITNALHKP